MVFLLTISGDILVNVSFILLNKKCAWICTQLRV